MGRKAARRSTMTGSDLKAWRTSRHLTQHQLGQLMAGLSKHTISRMEHDAQHITPLCELYLWLIAYGNIRRMVAEKVGVTLPMPIAASQ